MHRECAAASPSTRLQNSSATSAETKLHTPGLRVPRQRQLLRLLVLHVLTRALCGYYRKQLDPRT